MRLRVLCLALSLVLAGVSPPCAQGLNTRSWEDCLKAPDRACVLEKAIDLVSPLDKTDRRQTLVAAVAETWARAGEIDTATQLATQVPDRLPARIAVLQEIAAALARASDHEKAEAAFDEALQLARGSINVLQRAQTLLSIAKAQAGVGMKAAADTTFDQALEAASSVRIIGEKGRGVMLPAPDTQLALLLQQLAMGRAEAGEIGQALQITRSIAYDLRARARTLLALAEPQMRIGEAAEATLDEALAAEHGSRAGMAQWPSIRDSGIRVTENSSGDAGLLCDIAKAQARAGLTAKAVASFDEALRAAQAIVVPSALGSQDGAIADALVRIADAQREAGFNAAAGATLDRAALAAEATFGLDRPRALARLAEVRTKAGDAAQDIFARALSVARTLPDDWRRTGGLQAVATAQADAGLRDNAARTFAEAIGFARSQGGQTLGSATGIAVAQHRAGFIEEAAATFEEALTTIISDNEKGNTTRLVSLIHVIVANDRGKVLLAASPTLRIRLVEAAEAIAEAWRTPGKVRIDPLWPPRGQAAEVLSAIARALPN
jgi:tetratricopeptide (TPR) repeat protein